jgi:hypothetical protein
MAGENILHKTDSNLPTLPTSAQKLNGAASQQKTHVPEIIDPVFAKTSQNARFLLSENERFELVFVKTGSINSGTDHIEKKQGCGSRFALIRVAGSGYR